MYFEIDESTYMHSTFNIQHPRDSIGGNALIEGVAVMIDNEGQEYQAKLLQ
jgi:hypothetical protein